MEGSQTKICPNCKRDIPVDNFMIHSVHCDRNIRMCPVCKEPVPTSDLEEHHARMHKLLPCKKCGENVCGADLEDHIRDSCALTSQPCRYCQLELPRRELPPHEAYCGSRTEQCDACGEYVMIKYRQLHLDSNHAFLKLDDEPGPEPRVDSPVHGSLPIRPNGPILRAALSQPARGSTSTVAWTPIREAELTFMGPIDPRYRPISPICPYEYPLYQNTPEELDLIRMHAYTHLVPPLRNESGRGSTMSGTLYQQGRTRYINPLRQPIRPGSLRDLAANGLAAPTNQSAVLQTSIPYPQSSSGLLGGPENEASRPIPESPSQSNLDQSDAVEPDVVASSSDQVSSAGAAVNNNVKLAKNSTMMKRTNDQPQINTSVAASSKVNKDLPRAQRGPMKKRPAPMPPMEPEDSDPTLERDLANWQFRRTRHLEEAVANLEDMRRLEAQKRNWRPNGAMPAASGLVEHHHHHHITSGDFANLTPMSSDEFRDRFQDLQIRSDLHNAMGVSMDQTSADRFDEIKRDLQELRRGLNEVTAPYNSGAGGSPLVLSPEPGEAVYFEPSWLNQSAEPAGPGPEPEPPSADMDVDLPCEFCDAPWPAHQLVRHQRVCRIEYRPVSRSPSPRPSARPPPPEPEIPCEFCSLSFPMRMIHCHQMTCRQLPNRPNRLELPD